MSDNAPLPDEVAVVMLHVSGRAGDSQWFDYMPSFYSEAVRIEWNGDSMETSLPRDIAEILIRRGYARLAEAVPAEHSPVDDPPPEPPPEPPPQPSPQPSPKSKSRK